MNRKTIDFYDSRRYCNFLDILTTLECLLLLNNYSNVRSLYTFCTNCECYKAAIGSTVFICDECKRSC